MQEFGIACGNMNVQGCFW